MRCRPHPAPHLHFGVGRGAQQHKLRAALQRAPGGVLDQVNALLVRQPRDAAHHGHVCKPGSAGRAAGARPRQAGTAHGGAGPRARGGGRTRGAASAGAHPHTHQKRSRDCATPHHTCAHTRRRRMQQNAYHHRPLTRSRQVHAAAQLGLGRRLALDHAVCRVAARQQRVLCRRGRGGGREGKGNGAEGRERRCQGRAEGPSETTGELATSASWRRAGAHGLLPGPADTPTRGHATHQRDPRCRGRFRCGCRRTCLQGRREGGRGGQRRHRSRELHRRIACGRPCSLAAIQRVGSAGLKQTGPQGAACRGVAQRQLSASSP